MNNDKTYCTGENCGLKESCLRFTKIDVNPIYFFTSSPVIKTKGKEKCDWYEKLEQNNK